MALAVCSYPSLIPEDYSAIQDFRKMHDELYYTVIEPHFTFIFPVLNFEKEVFINEISVKSKGAMKIEFEVRCATVNKDAMADYFHLLLVPDKGYSDIVKLHDKLYSGILFKELRLDIDFIPHMAIANSKDKLVVKNWADEWNSKDFSIRAVIDTLMVVDYTDNQISDLKEIKLD